MTNDEAMKLARKVSKRIYENAGSLGTAPSDDASEIADLCDHILSGDHKREIENAAFERAAQIATSCQSFKLCTNATAIRSLIQPPAQKENGE